MGMRCDAPLCAAAVCGLEMQWRRKGARGELLDRRAVGAQKSMPEYPT